MKKDAAVPLSPRMPAVPPKPTAPPAPKPQLKLMPTQAPYALGSALSLQYVLVGAERIKIAPILYCPVGESDFTLTFVVRDASGALLPGLPPAAQTGVYQGTLKKDWLAKPGPRRAIVNDTIPIHRAGNYTVVAVLTVQRPAGAITRVQSEPLTVTVVDNATIRARRQAAIHHAARLVQDRSTPWSKPWGNRYAALQALRYLDDPAALPVLIEALGDPDLSVLEQAERNLLLWPDVRALENAAHSGLARASVQPQSAPVHKWERLLMTITLRKQFGANAITSEAEVAARVAAQRTIETTLASGLSRLPIGAATERRVDLVLYRGATGMGDAPLSAPLANLYQAVPDADILRPILAAAERMHPEGQARLGWLLSQWENRPKGDRLRSLRPELTRLAAQKGLHPDLAKAVRQVLRQTG